eukprot:CAMPEP_0170606098 /NCGR_PEP_ID=MMETSP0224-20130122/20325_1 /TAXON_ID=285029 /ORGANISM="Togula jolla, Strain CCCM 725" /LENGTH=56 /DNA_ID=CAMNT_0010931145 /DNA_START=946 /DNA_END=1113 /DNA_ORIENTATION=+
MTSGSFCKASEAYCKANPFCATASSTTSRHARNSAGASCKAMPSFLTAASRTFRWD